MLDLIFYWMTFTVLIVFTIYFTAFCINFVLDYLVEYITSGEVLDGFSRFTKKVFIVDSKCWCFKEDGYGRIFLDFEYVDSLLSFILFLIGWLGLVCIAMVSLLDPNLTFLGIYHNITEVVYLFVGWAAVSIISFILLLKSLRKGYTICSKINKLTKENK